jgi:hypothetical protein
MTVLSQRKAAQFDRFPATTRGLRALSQVSPARVMGPLVCHEHGTGLFRLQAVR